MGGQTARQSALAGRRGAVDGDDHLHPKFRAEPRHQRPEGRKAGGDHGLVVDRHRLLRREPHDEKAHGDAMVEMGFDQAAARNFARAALDDEVVAFDGRNRRHWRRARRRSPPAGRIPLPAIPASRACASSRAQKTRRRRGSDIRRSSTARARREHRRRSSSLARTRKSATLRRPPRACSRMSIRAPISSSVVRKPMRRGFIITPSTTISEPLTSSAAAMGKAAEDGSTGTTIGRANKFRPAFQHDFAAMLAIRARSAIRRRNSAAFFRYGRGWPRSR